MTRRVLLLLLVGLVLGLCSPDGLAAQVPEQGLAAASLTPAGLDGVQPALDGTAAQPGRFSKALEIALLLTALSLLPAVLITITSFTRIVIVLSFVRRALSINELPPNPVIIGLALFLTVFVMAPVGSGTPVLLILFPHIDGILITIGVK